MKLALAAGVVMAAACLADAQDPPIDPTVPSALDWLARHQDADGFWHTATFPSRCEGAKCTGVGAVDGDVGATALSLLAFLGAGETQQTGSHRDTVKRACKALRDLQDSAGFFGPRSAPSARLGNAYAALAVGEYYGMTGSRMTKEPAQRAVAFIASSQDASGGWKLATTDDACDPLLTSVCVLALRSGTMAELEVDVKTFDRVAQWLDSTAATTKATVDVRTAADLLSRVFARWDAAALAKDAAWADGTAHFGAHPPAWSETMPGAEFTAWCLGAEAVFQRGGDAWKTWWKAFLETVTARQCGATGGCARGSWDVVDPKVPFGGRVAATALVCRALETPYRIGRIKKPK